MLNLGWRLLLWESWSVSWFHSLQNHFSHLVLFLYVLLSPFLFIAVSNKAIDLGRHSLTRLEAGQQPAHNITTQSTVYQMHMHFNSKWHWLRLHVMKLDHFAYTKCLNICILLSMLIRKLRKKEDTWCCHLTISVLMLFNLCCNLENLW